MKFKPVPEPNADTFRMQFGKHKGKTFGEILESNDGKYIDWLIGQDWKDWPVMAKALAEYAGTNGE